MHTCHLHWYMVTTASNSISLDLTGHFFNAAPKTSKSVLTLAGSSWQCSCVKCPHARFMLVAWRSKDQKSCCENRCFVNAATNKQKHLAVSVCLCMRKAILAKEMLGSLSVSQTRTTNSISCALRRKVPSSISLRGTLAHGPQPTCASCTYCVSRHPAKCWASSFLSLKLCLSRP